MYNAGRYKYSLSFPSGEEILWDTDCQVTNGDCQATARVVLHRQLQLIF